MSIKREILARDKRYLSAVYDKHTTTYGLQQGNISTRLKNTLLQFSISTQ